MSEFNDAADTLINRLVEMADGKTSVPMLSLFHRTTLDVIAKVSAPYVAPQTSCLRLQFPLAQNFLNKATCNS